MIPARCSKCYSRLGPFPENHICPMPPKEKRGRKPKDPTKKIELRRTYG